MPTVFTDPTGKWKIQSDSWSRIVEPYYILHRHYEKSRLKRESRGIDYYWAWCYRSRCSECDKNIPDEITTLMVLLK